MGLPCDWQVTKQHVSQRGQYLLESGQWSDCKFIVGQEPQQQILGGHKLFLAMSSPVFEAMFYGSMAEKNEPIPIRDVQPEAFKTLLEYIYTDHVNLESFELACELCYCAKKYMLPFLVEECTKYLWSDLSPKKACRAFEFAKLFEEPVLLEKCLQIICSDTEEVLKESSWDEVELGTISTILDQKQLHIESEMELFEAVERWAKAECNRKSLLASDPKSLRSVTGNLVEKIRFLTLSPQQFAEGPGRSQLLTKDEAFAILMNVSSSGSNIPMPEGFSTSFESRGNKILKSEKESIGPIIPEREKRTIASLEMPIHDWGLNMRHFRSNSTVRTRQKLQADVEISDKYYCLRNMIQRTDCFNTNVLDSSISFKVDKNICIIGLEVPTQTGYTSGLFTTPIYTEILYAHLLDSDDSRLTYTHFTTSVMYGTFVEISFNRPVYIQKNKVYRLGVVFHKAGRYPIGECAKNTCCDTVNFAFGIGRSDVRDGLIRSIVFTYH